MTNIADHVDEDTRHIAKVSTCLSGGRSVIKACPMKLHE